MGGESVSPERTAFVSIDLQKGIAAMGRDLAPYKAGDVIKNAARLAEAFRKRGALVVLVNVNSKDGKDMLKVITDEQAWRNTGERPKDWAELVPELNKQESDLLITKRQWGAFHGTELDLQLRRRGIDTLVLCGISTNIGVETTAREAYQHGYNTIVAIDACSASDAQQHESSAKFIFPRLGRVRKTDEILAMLGQ
jgi:nicotinamidase-related amidase